MFAERLIAWQKTHGRHDLPWQGNRDPYHVWLSEIMLQQTQVATVIPYYERFLAAYPDLATLAAAPLEQVLGYWAGLGYYARARNLHRCAGVVQTQFGGQFPADAATIATLPGIGRSTAAAISVFAFGQRAAILDGNVKRVLSRCFGVEGVPGAAATETQLWALTDELLPANDLETYTQGLMDFGATLCTRSKPRCAACPMLGLCVAQREQRQDQLPAPKPRKVSPERETTMLLLFDGTRVLLQRRPPSGIWGGLLCPPEVEHRQRAAEVAALLAQRHGTRVQVLAPLGSAPLRHTFTHFRLTIWPMICRVDLAHGVAGEPGWQWLPLVETDKAALPTPVRTLLEAITGS